jgi:hypothetical protein
MAEQQLELETQGCERCGKELPDMHLGDLCFSCDHKIEHARTKFGMAQDVISALIYGHVSKSDLALLHEIIFKVAKQDEFASFEINQSQLAKDIGWQQANISRSLKKLVNSKLLIKNENLYSFGMSKIT